MPNKIYNVMWKRSCFFIIWSCDWFA